MRLSRFMLPTLFAAMATAAASAQSFEETLALAEFANPELEASRTQTEIAREALEEARAQGRVQVTLAATAGYESADTNRIFSTQVGERPLGTVQLEASRPIYTGGRIAAGVRAAKAGIDAADARLESARQSVNLNAIAAFLNVRAGQETVDIRENNVRVLEEQVRAANARFNVGFITRTDVALADSRLAGAQAGLASAQAQLEGFKADFEAVTGVQPGVLGPIPPKPVLPSDFEDALAQMLELNPSLVAAREDVRAASDAVDVAKAAGRPQIDIVGTASSQQEFDDNIYDSSVSAFARGRIPLFQGGLVSSQVRSATLRREQARLQVQAGERELRASLASAWYVFIAAERAIDSSRLQVAAAQTAFDGARQELAVGTRTTLDVLNSEQDLLNARLSLVNAERDAQLAAYQILLLTGQLSADRILPAPPAP